MGLEFDGEFSYVDMGDVVEANSAMSLFVRIQTFLSGSGVGTIISKYNIDTSGYNLSVSDSLIPVLKINNVQISGSALEENSLYSLVGVATGTNIYLYVNGIQVATAVNSNSSASNTSNLNIGRNPNNSEFYYGIIEDVRIYNRALNVNEILTMHYAYGKDNILFGLLSKWLFTEQTNGFNGNGLTIQDQCADNDGTVIEATYTASISKGYTKIIDSGSELITLTTLTKGISNLFSGDAITDAISVVSGKTYLILGICFNRYDSGFDAVPSASGLGLTFNHFGSYGYASSGVSVYGFYAVCGADAGPDVITITRGGLNLGSQVSWLIIETNGVFRPGSFLIADNTNTIVLNEYASINSLGVVVGGSTWNSVDIQAAGSGWTKFDTQAGVAIDFWFQSESGIYTRDVDNDVAASFTGGGGETKAMLAFELI